MSSYSNSRLPWANSRATPANQTTTPGTINDAAFPTLGQAATKDTGKSKPVAGNAWKRNSGNLASKLARKTEKKSSLAQTNPFAALNTDSETKETVVELPSDRSDSVVEQQTESGLTPPATPALPPSPQYASFADSVRFEATEPEDISKSSGRVVVGSKGKYLSAREYLNIVTPFDPEPALVMSSKSATFGFNFSNRMMQGEYDTFVGRLKHFHAQPARLAPLSGAEELSFARKNQRADYARFWGDLEV
ncbi:hypothetical protein K491DRAFT_683762 [Lophiostoma macrostomum CBS 122681]|uniref:Uncharacterized protein n=1 Tax=Lophiostoma macrostomum CBS 122681 TaxID=1314788 RepID=A0A6A6SPB2_9PLEO|nr:hypothetical protein K491DRAFT_683762 [Lophiostoma macrostomum CBS 122681]